MGEYRCPPSPDNLLHHCYTDADAHADEYHHTDADTHVHTHADLHADTHIYLYAVTHTNEYPHADAYRALGHTHAALADAHTG